MNVGNMYVLQLCNDDDMEKKDKVVHGGMAKLLDEDLTCIMQKLQHGTYEEMPHFLKHNGLLYFPSLQAKGFERDAFFTHGKSFGSFQDMSKRVLCNRSRVEYSIKWKGLPL